MPLSRPDGKRFYGAITVSDRGQIVIPAEARRDFAIEVGDKLLVFGDLEQGLAIM
jgi:AbrB family looped-hinge helix DNA binding protein